MQLHVHFGYHRETRSPSDPGWDFEYVDVVSELSFRNGDRSIPFESLRLSWARFTLRGKHVVILLKFVDPDGKEYERLPLEVENKEQMPLGDTFVFLKP